MTGTRIVVTQNDFARIAAELGPKLQTVVVSTAYSIESEAKQQAPVKTANLWRSIGTDFKEGPLHAEVGTDVEYAKFVHDGTSRMAGRPFLAEPVEHHRQRFIAAVRAVFNR